SREKGDKIEKSSPLVSKHYFTYLDSEPSLIESTIYRDWDKDLMTNYKYAQTLENKIGGNPAFQSIQDPRDRIATLKIIEWMFSIGLQDRSINLANRYLTDPDPVSRDRF